MVGRAFSVKINLEVHAVTCPGVWLCPNGKVALQIRIFESSVATHKLTPIFPLLFHDKFTFKQVFTGVTTLAELENKLSQEYIFAKLIQWSSATNRTVILATFETNLVDLLYPAPCFKGLLAGVDVDLLMEPLPCFPGILSPKIEVSTNTTIEEAIDLDVKQTDTYLINPKLIKPWNQRCIHKKKELEEKRKPIKQTLLRQKRVCHSKQEKVISYICRNCRRQQNNTQVVHNCNNSSQCLLPSAEKCYLSELQKKPTCNCSVNSPKKFNEHYSIYNDAHILESCPICLKYKCYFTNNRSHLRSVSKFYNESTNFNHSDKMFESRTKLFSESNYNKSHENKNNNLTTNLCNTLDSLDLQNDKSKSNFKIHNEDSYCKHSPSGRHNCNSICRSSSAPSLNGDTTSILLAKMKQLERTKERLNYMNCPGVDYRDTDQNNDFQDNYGKKGFYKNLEKFYKRMYKQAKRRACDFDGT